MLQESYKLSSSEVLKHFDCDAIGGLEIGQVKIQKEKYGLNGTVILLCILSLTMFHRITERRRDSPLEINFKPIRRPTCANFIGLSFGILCFGVV